MAISPPGHHVQTDFRDSASSFFACILTTSEISCRLIAARMSPLGIFGTACSEFPEAGRSMRRRWVSISCTLRGLERRRAERSAEVRKGQVHEPLFCLAAGRLQHFREQQGKTQRELAEATGLTEDYISKIERGINLVTKIETIAKLALALHLLPEELISQDTAELPEVQWLRQEVLDITPRIVLATLASDQVLLSWQDIHQMLRAKASIQLSTAL